CGTARERDGEVEREQRDRDREHAVAERLEPSLRHHREPWPPTESGSRLFQVPCRRPHARPEPAGQATNLATRKLAPTARSTAATTGRPSGCTAMFGTSSERPAIDTSGCANWGSGVPSASRRSNWIPYRWVLPIRLVRATRARPSESSPTSQPKIRS